jgi:hypothetical protein
VVQTQKAGDPGTEPGQLEYGEGYAVKSAVRTRGREDAPQDGQPERQGDAEDPAARVGVDAETPSRRSPEREELEGEGQGECQTAHQSHLTPSLVRGAADLRWV